MLFDRFVDAWLGYGRIIDLAVPVAPIADQINHDIAAEGVAIFDCQSPHAQNGIHILAIHMENRNALSSRKLSCETRGMEFL